MENVTLDDGALSPQLAALIVTVYVPGSVKLNVFDVPTTVVDGDPLIPVPDRETIHLSAAQVDRLRVALRAAVISLGGLEDDETCASPAHVIPVQRSSGLPRAAGHSNG